MFACRHMVISLCDEGGGQGVCVPHCPVLHCSGRTMARSQLPPWLPALIMFASP